MMVGNLYVKQNTEDNKSFLCHKQLSYDITQHNRSFTDNTSVNLAELETTDMFNNGKHALAFYSPRDT